MALMTITNFRKKCFDEGSAPCVDTVMKWIKNGDIYSKKIGSTYYIDTTKEEFVPVNDLVTKIILNSQN